MLNAHRDLLLRWCMPTRGLKPHVYASAALAVALVINCERKVETEGMLDWHVWRKPDDTPVFRSTFEAEWVEYWDGRKWARAYEQGAPEYALVLEANLEAINEGRHPDEMIPCRSAWSFDNDISQAEASFCGIRVEVMPHYGTAEYAYCAAP